MKEATGNVRAMEFLRQRVSIESQRGTAAAVMGTVDESKEWNSLFLLSQIVSIFFYYTFASALVCLEL